MEIDKYQIYLGGISMDYNALIQNRKSARQFTDQKLWNFGDNTRQALEGAAGYNEFLVGAPQCIRSRAHPRRNCWR